MACSPLVAPGKENGSAGLLCQQARQHTLLALFHMGSRTAHILQRVLPVVGLTTLWLTVFNRLLYPSKYTFYHLDTQMDGLVQTVYAIAFALAAFVILVAVKQPERALLAHGRTVAAVGIAATAGVLLPLPFEDKTGMGIAAVVLGALLVAAFVSSHFMYWTIRGRALSVRYTGLAASFSLVCFFLIDLLFTLTGSHSIAFVAACPLVSSCAIALALVADSSGRDSATRLEPAVETGAESPVPALEVSVPVDLDAIVAHGTPRGAFEGFAEEFDLSKRETELAELAYRNLSARKIAEELFIAESTVYTHLKRIYRKTGVHSKQELIDLIDTRHVRHP